MEYLTGHVKRNPDTGAVAIRTIFPTNNNEQLANMAWLVATTNIGARHIRNEDAEGWDDLYTPEPPPADPSPEDDMA